MTFLPLALSLFAASAYAAKSSKLYVQFNNQSRFNLTITVKYTKNSCITYPQKTIQIPAGRSKKIAGNYHCGYFDSATTYFYVKPNISWNITPSKAYIKFNCGADIMGCGALLNNFPIKLLNPILQTRYKIKAKSTGSATPFTFSFY